MSLVDYTVKDRVAFITLDRAEKRNALNHELVTDLKQAFDRAATDESAKVIVLRANGVAFCSGADLEYLQQLQKFSFEENIQDSNHLKELFLKIYRHPKVVIAQVQGHAIAGGCGLATVCDFVVSVPAAKFGYTEVKIGFIPAIVTVFLLRKLGETKAKEMLLSGDLFSAEQLRDMGLVNQVIETDKIEAYVFEFALKLVAENSAESMKLTKQMIAAVPAMSLENALTYAAEMNAKARNTEDCKRGIAAFLNKEKLTW